MIETETVELVWDARCTVGESPVWDARNGRLLFCDIDAGRIHAYSPADGIRHGWNLPGQVASFGLCRSGRLVVALRDRVVLFDPRDGTIAPLTAPIGEPVSNRLNDGKVGPDGCFWVGSMNEADDHAPSGALYRVSPDGRVERKVPGIVCSNGLAWTPDGRTMFHSDTYPGAIDAWDFDAATGAISRRRRIATLSAAEGLPDGGACDSDGCYWSAGVSAGCLHRFSRDGLLLQRIALPVPSPTMPCFAGDALFVTSLTHAAQRHVFPSMGGLFRLPATVAGCPVDLFDDTRPK